MREKKIGRWGRQDVKTNYIYTLSPQFKEKKKNTAAIAEDGFDPSTSGLWAQHAPTAPLCYLAMPSHYNP